jgi:tetratricopeptide (TPR) repeat protein
MALAPALFFLVLEFGLRLVGFGEPACFFLKIPGADAYTTNQNFVYRFFSREVAIRPAPAYLPADKPPGGYRVFVLGGSAALGDLAPEFGFGRILQVMLRSSYPGAEFEVVNAAVAAVDSNVVLQVAREAADHAPDLFVVYLGNNEVVGPYGPDSLGDSLVGRRRPPTLMEIRAGLWVRTTRVGQLIQRWVTPERWRKGDPVSRPRSGADLLRTLVRLDDPRLEATYGRFQKNLEDLLHAAGDARAKVIVATVASNLSDFSPFASLHPADLTREERALFGSAYRNGLELGRRGEWAAAIRRFESAARIDSGFAQLHFELGRCFLGARHLAEARESLIRARDLDAGRYRADSAINQVIRRTAEDRESEGVHLVDAERSLGGDELGRSGLYGNELFYDHVHLTFEGNYALARSIFDQVARILPERIRSRASAPPDAPSLDRVAESLALTEWDLARLADLLSLRHRTLGIAAAEAGGASQPQFSRRHLAQEPRLRESAEIYRRAIARDPVDLHLRRDFAALLLELGDTAGAEQQLRFLVERVPRIAEWRAAHGEVLALEGRLAEAIEQLRAAVRLDPGDLIARARLGDALREQGEVGEALASYQQVLKLKPDARAVQLRLGTLLLGRGELDRALAHFEKALQTPRRGAGVLEGPGVARLERQGLAQAIEQLRAASEDDPRAQAIREGLEAALRQSG